MIYILTKLTIEIYTDGSCHTLCNIGAWASILLLTDKKILLKGEEINTTNNRMELTAVIKAIEFVDENYKHSNIVIYTDSQYVSRIPDRMEKLKKNNFITKKGTSLQNCDLVKLLICQIENNNIEFVKVKAHQKTLYDSQNTSINYNSEVDKLARQMVRESVIKQ